MTGLGDKVAQILVSRLLKTALVKTDTPLGPVRFRLSLDALQFCFPDLYPEAATRPDKDLIAPQPPSGRITSTRFNFNLSPILVENNLLDLPVAWSLRRNLFVEKFTERDYVYLAVVASFLRFF